MTWEEYYDRFYDWANSTQISRISKLTSFGSSDELCEIAIELCDEKAATRLIKKAVATGVVFSADQIIDLSKPGLGYRVDEERRFHIDPEGAAVVREIVEMYASGKTVTEITKYLNANQVKTSLGKEFNKNSLHRPLRNKRYIGYYIYKGMETPNGMPHIIDDELFQRVQHILDCNKKAKVQLPQLTEKPLTDCFLVCKYCV